MEFRLLGPLEVRDAGEPLPLGGPQQRAVLAYLLLRANEHVPTDQLIAAVWGEDPPDAVRSSLHSYVSRLRKVIGSEPLEGRSAGYVLHVDPSEVDALRFEAMIDRARQVAVADPAEAAALYDESLALWRGDPLEDLEDLAHRAGVRAEIARLEELRLAATEERIDAELALGRHAEVTAELERLTAAHPLRERLWGQLMVATYRSGRQADALATFRRARETLAEELGVDPSPELQRLHEQVLRHDPGLELAGVPLRSYRLLERIGAGAFGVVYRALQPQVDREVAVKVLRPALANDAAFIRRFEAEAQLVARLEHQHLVPVYDYWRGPDGACLVMRYLRGGSLRDALDDAPLETDVALDVVADVGRALHVAHEQGVVHRDVKPENILFDEEANAYLSDFGVAKDLAAVADGGRQRTPSDLVYYLSPEEARGEPATPRTDVYSLGLVVYEMLAGRHPFDELTPDELVEAHLREPVPPLGEHRDELPPAVDEVIARATAKDPEERFADTLELDAALRDALAADGAAVAAPTVGVRNPYKGLRAFTEADAGDFFGRERLVEQLVARLVEPGAAGRFVAVVGPSGSGKSSLVRAGLIPALRDGAVAGSERWFVTDLLPGAECFIELRTALQRVASHHLPPNLADRLREDPVALLRTADWVLPDDAELVVVVDQFEELFTQVDDEQARRAFLDCLVTAVTDPESRVRVVTTLRADFYDRPLTFPRFAPVFTSGVVNVTPLAPGELERAIVAPAESVGVPVDASLVATVVADVADEPGALPLLQYALTEMFERRDRSALTLEVYRELGGISGALARRAEETHGALDDGAQAAARQLFLRLVTPAEAAGDTRRRVRRGELLALGDEPDTMTRVIDAFGRARLLSFDRDPETREPTVEVAHEALLTVWDRLRGWIDDARIDLRTARRLAAATHEWADAGQDASYLATGSRLEQFEALEDDADVALAPGERAFLEASVAERDRLAAEEAARSARERELERRSLRRLRGLVAVLTVATLVAGGLTLLAFGLAGERAEQVRIATARELAAAAIANLDVDAERSILLALEAVEATREADGTVLREAEEALRQGVRTFRGVYTVPQGSRDVAITADGNLFATIGADGTATVWETDTAEEVIAIGGEAGPLWGVAVDPDGTLLAAGAEDGAVRVWEVASGEERHVLRGHEGGASVAFSPDGRRLATADHDATVRLWDAATGTEEMVLTGHDPGHLTRGLEFSSDGSHLMSGSIDRTVRIWDLETGEETTVLEIGVGVTDAVFHPDGDRIAVATTDGRPRIWDVASGAELVTFFGPTGLVLDVHFSPDGDRLATAGADGIAHVWDAATGEPLMTLAGHTTAAFAVAFTPDGDGLLTTSLDDTTRLWDVSLGGSRDWLTLPGPAGNAAIGFTADGDHLVIPDRPHGVVLRDVDGGEVVGRLEGYEATIMNLAVSPAGGRLAATAPAFPPEPANEIVPVWDLDSGELVAELTGHEAEVVVVAFSPDGSRVITGGADSTARVWDVETGELRGTFELGGRWVLGVAFSSDGRLVAAGDSDGTVTLRDAETLEEVRAFGAHPGSEIKAIAFGPEGWMVTAADDGAAKVWDIESGEELMTFEEHTGVVRAAVVSPDGTRVATGSDDGTAKLWDPRTGRELLTLHAHEFRVYGVGFSPDGRLLATSSPDGTVALHLLPIDEFLEVARDRVTRELTDDERRRYLSGRG